MESLIDQKFGKLTVLRFHGFGHGTRPRPHWLCICECGNQHIASGPNLKAGHIRSCRCLWQDGARKANYKHGLHKTAILSTWRHMMERCYRPSTKSFYRYGGRGITVCQEWHDVKKFLQDVGHQPRRGMSIDRINNDGNYEPGNVRWSYPLQQANNRSTNRLHTINGITHTQAEWCDIYKLRQPTVCLRLKRGWTIQEALEIH